MLQGVTIIDADGHIQEWRDQMVPFMEEPYRQGKGPCFFPERGSWDISMGNKWGKDVYDVPTRLKDMATEGIDLSILYPTLGLNIGSVWGEPEFAQALCRGYNNWLSALVKEAPERLKFVALVAPQYPDFCVREANRAVTDLGAIGVFLAPHGHGKDLGGKEFWPLYEECQRLGVPVGIHSGNPLAASVERFNHYIGVHTVCHPLEQWIACTGIVLGGIPELFPDVKIAFLEGNVGWVPFLADRMDREFEKRAPEAPYLKAKPGEYVRSGRLYFGAEPDEKLLPWVISEIGQDVILYASDYPHWDMDFPDSARDIMERDDLTLEQKRKIMTDTPSRFYNLRVPARV